MLLTAMQGIALLVLIVLLPYYLMFMSERARLVSSLPGPTPLPFIGNLLDVGLNGIDFIRIMVALREKYGSIVRMWFGPYLVVAVCDPRHAEIFLASKTNIKKSLHYRFMEPLVGKGILTSAGDKWRSDRKLINPAFHYTLLEGFASVFNSQASILTQKLKKEVGGSEFPINKYLTRCSLDIACETSMGVRMNIQDNENNEYLQAVSGIEPVVIKRMLRPWLYPDFLFRLTGLWKRQNALLKALLGTSEKIIQRKKREFLVKEKESENDVNENGIGHKQRSPFLNLLLQNEKNGHLTDQDIRDQVNTFLAAGHDTVAVAVCFCLWLLANHPQYQERAYEELNSIFGDSDREATTEDVHNMKYLETVLKETMRLYPPVPICLRELEEEVKFDGCQLLPGTTILLSVYLIHRHPDYFPEPEKFDPDRFSPERAKGRHPFAFVPFSAGPRNCIGQKFAMIAMKTIISKILRTYKLLPGTTKPVFTIDIALKSCTGFHIKLEDRR